jgi:hypothetical protein
MTFGQIESPEESDATIQNVAELFRSGEIEEGRELFGSIIKDLHPYTTMLATEDLLGFMSGGHTITPFAFQTVRRELGHIEPVRRTLLRIMSIYQRIGIPPLDA